MIIRNLTLLAVLAPLLGCLITGLCTKRIGRCGVYWISISLMTISFFKCHLAF